MTDGAQCFMVYSQLLFYALGHVCVGLLRLVNDSGFNLWYATYNSENLTLIVGEVVSPQREECPKKNIVNKKRLTMES
jgi:hypothetical protein